MSESYIQKSHPSIEDFVRKELHSKMKLTDIDKYLFSIKDSRMLKSLLDAGADINAKNDGKTLLMLKYRNGDSKFFKMLLDFGADVNAKDKDGNTIFMIAMTHSNEISYSKYGHTAYFKYPRSHEVGKFIEMVIKHDPDLNAQNNKGETALMRAVKYNGDGDVIRVLLEYNVDTSIRDNDGKSASEYLGYDISDIFDDSAWH